MVVFLQLRNYIICFDISINENRENILLGDDASLRRRFYHFYFYIFILFLRFLNLAIGINTNGI